jgi:hypothetical protein
MNVDYKFNQRFKTLFCYFHQALMGIKMFFMNTCIPNFVADYIEFLNGIKDFVST